MGDISKYSAFGLVVLGVLCSPQSKPAVKTEVKRSNSDLDIDLEIRQMKDVDTGQSQVSLRVSMEVEAKNRRAVRFNSISISAYDIGSATSATSIEVKGRSTLALVSDERNITSERLSVSYSHDGEVPQLENGNIAYLDYEIMLPKGRGYVIWTKAVVSNKGKDQVETRSLPIAIAVK